MIELLIVISIIAVLGGYVLIKFSGVQGRARDTRRQSDVRQYQNLLEIYANNHNNLFPIRTGGSYLTTLCSTLGQTSCPDDPQSSSGRHYRYYSDANGYVYLAYAQLEAKDDSGNTQYFVVCSSGKAGQTLTQPTSSNCPL